MGDRRRKLGSSSNGRLSRADGNTSAISYTDSNALQWLSVPASEVREIVYVNRGRGALHGLIAAETVGAILGAVVFAGLGHALCDTADCQEIEAGIAGGLLGGVTLGAVFGLPIGAAIGSRDRFVFVARIEP